MKKNKGFAKFLLTFSAFLGISITSCGQINKHISLFIYSSSDTFMASYSSQIQNTLRSKYEIRVFDGENSQSYQNSQIVDEINDSSTKVLLINLVDRLAAKTIVEKATKVSKPIIFINREPLEKDIIESSLAYYVGAKPESDGELQAEIVNEYFTSPENFLESFDRNSNGQLDIVLVKGEQGHQDTENRSKFSINKLRDLGYNVNILETRFCDRNRTTSRDYFAEIYQFIKGDVDLVLSNNDDMALGVIDYLTSLEDYDETKPLYETYFPIIGVDATDVGLDAVKEKKMYGTVRNDYEKQVEIIDKLIEYLLNNLDINTFPFEMDRKNFFHTDGIKITQINYESVIKNEE